MEIAISMSRDTSPSPGPGVMGPPLIGMFVSVTAGKLAKVS